jgi:hypothetical protein
MKVMLKKTTSLVVGFLHQMKKNALFLTNPNTVLPYNASKFRINQSILKLN